MNSVDSYLKVTKFKFAIKDHCLGGVRTFRQGLAAFRFHGDSMIGNDIRHGDTGIYEQRDFEYIRFGKPALIEKVGEEEGTGAWAVKKIVIRQQRSYVQNEWGETIDWDDPIIELRSSNPRIQPWQLEPTRQYRLSGYLVRVLRPEEVELVALADCIDDWPKALFN